MVMECHDKAEWFLYIFLLCSYAILLFFAPQKISINSNEYFTLI